MQSLLNGKTGIILEFITGIIYERCARVRSVELRLLIDLPNKSRLFGGLRFIDRNTFESQKDGGGRGLHDLP